MHIILLLSTSDRLVVHWDGKILTDIVGRSHVDRTASFDSTSTNTSLNKGAAALLSDLLGQKLINLARRHHIYELVCKNVFEKKYGKSSAPETLIFNRFAKEWPTINQDQFNHSLEDPIVCSSISDDDCNQIKQFCQKQLQQTQIRGDYKELLELAFTFLGGKAASLMSQLKAKDPSVGFVEYRKHSNPEELLKCDLSHFVSYKTKTFFSRFELQTDFFDVDPSVRENNEEYLRLPTPLIEKSVHFSSFFQ